MRPKGESRIGNSRLLFISSRRKQYWSDSEYHQRRFIIPHGTALSNAAKKISRSRLKLPEDGKILLMFGFVKPFKGVHVSLKVLDAIREEVEDIYLFVAGSLAPTASKEERDYVEFLRKWIKELDLHEKVIFPNRFFPNEDIPYIIYFWGI